MLISCQYTCTIFQIDFDKKNNHEDINPNLIYTCSKIEFEITH